MCSLKIWAPGAKSSKASLGYFQLQTQVLFKKFNISKLELCLSCVSPLYATGRYTGVVVSSGYNFTEIMAIYESTPECNLGYPMTLESQVVNVGSEAISKKLRQLIKINNPDSKDEHLLKE